MKNALLGFLFLIICAFSVNAQTEEAWMLDEFGAGVPCDEYLARANATAIVQGNNPNSRIYIFIYEGKLKTPVYTNGEPLKYKLILPQYGLAKARIESMKKYYQRRKLRLDNFVFVNGGLREEFWVEIWVVPPGAQPPKPTPTLKRMKYRKGKARGFCLGCC